ncbi:MAG: NADH-quinone oxidoreductase subunit G, partial [Micropruina sp.]
MTLTANTAQVVVSDLITVTIDGIDVQVPKGTLAIRAAEMIGVAIPRFCDHPLLEPMGACRQCLVEVPDMGNGRGMPKPQASCTLECAPGMKIATQVTSPVAEKAQRGMIEFLLINHPLDCPICDKGGECPLQNQAMSSGRGESRYEGVKRTFPKPVSISAQILLDRERCVLCARCTRFSEQISGDPFIALVERGALQQVGFYEDQPYDSYFSGNVVQICPVGALTSAAYRFQSRPFDLVSTPTTCEHCAAGCQLRSDHRHYQVKRRLAGDAPEVNEEWNCDRGRFAFVSGRGEDRLRYPLIREDGVLRPASWPEAIDAAVAGLSRLGDKVGVLTGGRLTLEDSYGYAKFARTVLGTNNIDFRARPHTAEEADFLATRVAGRTLGEGVSYAALEEATQVVLVGLEPEEESPIVFLRLRKATRKNRTHVVTLAPFASNGTVKLGASLVQTAPGEEAAALDNLTADANTVILLGERAGWLPGVLTAAAALADRSGAALAWV